MSPSRKPPSGRTKRSAALAIGPHTRLLPDEAVEGVPDEAAARGEPVHEHSGLADGEAAEREQTRVELQERIGAYLERGRPRIILTDNIHTMVSVKCGDGVTTFRLHHMFVEAPPQVLRALGRYAHRQDRSSAKLLRDFIDGNEHYIRRREIPRPIPLDVEGKYHNLQVIFDRINDAYFGGKISARITWGARGRRRHKRDSIKLGSYTFEDALIRIHPVLDARDVPVFFVEWIVYHEMLHEIHDMPVVDGRRVHHTAEFRRAEARFEDYTRAVLWERTQLHKLLER